MHKIERNTETMYYLYRHVGNNNNIPFYIGIGVKRKLHSATTQSEYERAFYFTKRSIFWTNCYNKYNGCKIDILYESNCKKVIKEKEIEFISLYGRRDLNKGTLCNLTDGGELSFTFNIETELLRRSKITLALLKRVRKKSTFEKIGMKRRKKIKITNDKHTVEFNSMGDAATYLKCSMALLSKAKDNMNKSAKGYKVFTMN